MRVVRLTCPVHGLVYQWVWDGSSFTVGTCDRIDCGTSKTEGRIIRCGLGFEVTSVEVVETPNL